MTLTPVRGSKTGRPIMVVLDLLGRRWALRILWELHGGARNFRDLRAACDDMSPSVLNQRLRELRDAGVVDHAAGGYELTQDGRGLMKAFRPLNEWSKRWGRR